MTSLLLISGSLRADSHNSRLLPYLAQRLEGRCEIDTLSPDQVGLPLFDQDMESDAAVVDQVSVLHQRFKACDGFVVASPEYNGQPTAYLKNMVDWVSRLAHIDSRYDNPFRGRPLLLCSASTGWSGGAVAIPHARSLFGYVGCMVLGDTVCIPYANQARMGDSYLLDPFYDMQIDEAMDRILQQAQIFNRARRDLSTLPHENLPESTMALA